MLCRKRNQSVAFQPLTHNVDRWFQRQFFSKCGHFGGIRCHYAYQYRQTLLNLFCPVTQRTPPKKVRIGVKGHRVHLTVVFLKSISVLVFVFAKEGANLLIDIGQHTKTDVVV